MIKSSNCRAGRLYRHCARPEFSSGSGGRGGQPPIQDLGTWFRGGNGGTFGRPISRHDAAAVAGEDLVGAARSGQAAAVDRNNFFALRDLERVLHPEKKQEAVVNLARISGVAGW